MPTRRNAPWVIMHAIVRRCMHGAWEVRRCVERPIRPARTHAAQQVASARFSLERSAFTSRNAYPSHLQWGRHAAHTLQSRTDTQTDGDGACKSQLPQAKGWEGGRRRGGRRHRATAPGCRRTPRRLNVIYAVDVDGDRQPAFHEGGGSAARSAGCAGRHEAIDELRPARRAPSRADRRVATLEGRGADERVV